ncbi:MAG: M28 family peptidase [Brumimicrobium sp.]
MWSKIFVLFFGISFFHFTFSQVENARKITETLCSDTLYGRGYVNQGVNKAANFIKNEYKKVGLSPFFGDTSYFQFFTFDVNSFPGKIEVKDKEKTYKPGIDYLINQYSGSYSGQLKLYELDSITIFNLKQNLQHIVDIVQNGESNSFLIDLTAFSSKNHQKISQIGYELANLVPVVLLSDDKLIWSVARQQLPFPIITFKKEIFTNNHLSVTVEAELLEGFESKNVVGYVPAKKNPHKAKSIVFTAHYDHLGMMGTSPSPTLFPGGNDNASGTTMLISLAEYFAKNPSKYNIIFMAFAGEEAGLLGSKYFVESKELELSQIEFLINLDIMGSGEDGVAIVNGQIFQKHFEELSKINDKNGYLKDIKARGEAANSDHWYFYEAGVPSIFIYTIGLNKNYHDVDDTYEALSFAAYNNIVQLLIDFVKTF